VYHGSTGDVSSMFTTFAVQGAATTTALQATASSQGVTLTATVTPASASTVPVLGQVIFREGTTVLGMRSVNGNASTLKIALPAGSHTLTASFDGTADFAGSTSPGVAVTVGQVVGATATTTTLAASATSSTPGQGVTFTATVRGGTGSGVP